MSLNTRYPTHSIGQHITSFQLTFNKDQTIQEVLNLIQKKIGSWPNSEKIYVLDENRKLIGEITFKELLEAKPTSTLETLMDNTVDSLTDHAHQSTVIKLAVRKGMESIPVVDREDRFLGIIDSSQILKIMHEEHVEKLMHFSGILNNESLIEGYKANIMTVAKSRLPWLFMGLVGGVISTFIIENYSPALEQEIALAFFIPVIVYMNDAVGTQAQTVFVRNSALEKIHLVKSMIFELKVTFVVAFALSILMYFFADIWLSGQIALVVTLSMFLGIISSALIGTVIPWLLEKNGKDPAIGSGPFTTIIQDLISILIYFSIASYIL